VFLGREYRHGVFQVAIINQPPELFQLSYGKTGFFSFGKKLYPVPAGFFLFRAREKEAGDDKDNYQKEQCRQCFTSVFA
jgi:hypothetical protein